MNAMATSGFHSVIELKSTDQNKISLKKSKDQGSVIILINNSDKVQAAQESEKVCFVPGSVVDSCCVSK